MARKFTAGFLVSLLIIPSIFFTLPRKVGATGWPVFDAAVFGAITADATRTSVLDGLNAVAMFGAQILIEQIVASTVQWANTGFDGNPAYAVDSKQYFTDIADGIAGEFIQGSDLNFLCSPFQANIRLSLAHQYYEPEPFQCTLTDVVGNIDNFLDDFSQGGWDAWFVMTQNPTNNPYGAYLEAKIELDSRIAAAVGLEREQLNWNSGFLSWSDCIELNPPAVNDDGSTGNLPSKNIRHVPGKAVGECIQRGPVKTPGSIIKSGLDKVLPSGLEKLITVEHVNQLATAFARGLLDRFVFGERGLFGKDTSYEYDATTLRQVPNFVAPDPNAPENRYASCTASCQTRHCSAPAGPNNESGPSCNTTELNACVATCSTTVSQNSNNAVTHRVAAGNTVIVTATLPNLPSGKDLVIRVDGTDKFTCRYTPCNYANTYEDGTYTYDAYYVLDEGQTNFLQGGSFTLPATASTNPGDTGESKNWTTDQWRSYVFDTLFPSKGIGSTWSYTALSATRAELNARGADWQFDSAGNLRPRLYLPTQFGGPLAGDYSRAVDVTDPNVPPGTPWRWFPR